MKKRLYLLLAIGLVVSTAFMAGCGKKDNPFEPTTVSYNSTGVVSNKGPTVATCTDLSGNQTLYHTPAYDEIAIVFDSDMNAATINATNIKLNNVENMTAPIAYTVTYDAGTKKAVIKITGVWEDNKSYMVTVTNSVRDLRGNSLDGNANGDNQDPQDNYHQQFWGADATVQYYNFRGPTAGVYPGNNQLAFAISDSIMVTITDNLTAPIDSIDPSTLDISDFSLTTEAGVNVPLTWTTPTEIVTPQRSYLVKFKPTLAQATNYIFTVKSAGLKDIHGNSLDGNGNGISEKASKDDVVVRFRTYDPYPTGLHLIVREAFYTDNNNTLVINFTRKMNASTLNNTNIKLYDNSDATGYIPGTIRILPDSTGLTYSLENRPYPLGTDYLWVSRAVRDTGGLMLDQNNNNIGGEPANMANGYVSDDFVPTAFPYTAGIVRCIFDENVENGSNGWSAQRLWHRTTRRASATWGGIYSWHCGVDADSSYLVAGPTAVNDTLFLPAMNCITYTNGLRIVYDWWSRTDGAADATRLIYSIDNGANWNLVSGSAVYSGNQNSWTLTTWYNCNPGRGQMVRFAFAFNTDATGNIYPSEGFYLDNIRVYAW
jgi:hypothetical protein